MELWSRKIHFHSRVTSIVASRGYEENLQNETIIVGRRRRLCIRGDRRYLLLQCRELRRTR